MLIIDALKLIIINSWKPVHDKVALPGHNNYLTGPNKYQDIEVK